MIRKTRNAYWRVLSLVLAATLLFSQVAMAEVPPYPTLSDGPADGAAQSLPSTRLIVELDAPPLTEPDLVKTINIRITAATRR